MKKFLFVYVCISYLWVASGGQKRTSDCLGMELWTVVRPLTWVLLPAEPSLQPRKLKRKLPWKPSLL